MGERAKRPFNDLSPAQAERLALLLEEMGEAQQAIGKILRHGYDSYNPMVSGPSNKQALVSELGDVLAAMQILSEAKDLSMEDIVAAARAKCARVWEYLHHQKEARR